MGILNGNPRNEPLHYGEIFGLWSFLLGGKAMVTGYETLKNHAGDKDLNNLLEEAIQQCKHDNKQIEELLKEQGVGLPPSPPERPKASLDKISVGARFQDPEIAATMSADVAAGLITCSQMIGQAIREDVAMVFGQIHSQKVTFGAKLLRLNKEKGWLVVPPLHKNDIEDR